MVIQNLRDEKKPDWPLQAGVLLQPQVSGGVVLNFLKLVIGRDGFRQRHG